MKSFELAQPVTPDLPEILLTEKQKDIREIVDELIEWSTAEELAIIREYMPELWADEGPAPSEEPSVPETELSTAVDSLSVASQLGKIAFSKAA